MSRRICHLLLLLMSLSLPSHAAWYESSGSAPIDGDLESARQAAIDDAVRNALIFAGMELHSGQMVENGVLTSEHLSWSSHASVHNIRLLSETRSGDRLNVQIHAELRATPSDCQNPRPSRKRMKLDGVTTANLSHLTLGGLYRLGEDNRSELVRQIERVAGQRVSLLDSLDAPYRMTVTIADATLLEDYPPAWKLWDEPPRRALKLLVSLHHSHSGEPVLSQEYGGAARWPFAATEQIDSSTARYWQSSYGALNRSLLEQVARDLNHALACKPLYGRVVSVQGKRLWLDIGVKDGINQGFTLNLYKTRQFLEADGSVRTVLLAESRTVKVSGVDGERSYIDFANIADAAGYQSGDQVIEP